jgi:hypothetical protein
VQDRHGNPIKFFSTDPDVLNVVVVDATKSILGIIDIYDCLLATYGDPAVDEVYRRGIFGLFQEDRPESLSGVLCVRHTMSTHRRQYAKASQEDAEGQRSRASGDIGQDPAGVA